MTVELNFTNVQSIMKDYEHELEKQDYKPWVRTATKVATAFLFTLGMIAFLSSSVVGLPGWLVVATLVGWAASVILSAIYMQKVKKVHDQSQMDIEMCQIINSKTHDDHAQFKKKFDELKITVPNKGLKRKILDYSRIVKQGIKEKVARAERKEYLSKRLNEIFT